LVFSQTLLFTLLLILMGGLFQFIPALTRPDLFFAVTVLPEFRRTADARGILRRYRTIVWSTTLASIILELAAGIVVVSMLFQLMGFLLALAAGHRACLTYATVPSSIVEVDLAMPQERLPGGPIVALLPVLFIGALGVWVCFHWDRLPAHFPVHWGFNGPDRWVATTPAAVFGFLALHASLCLLLAGLAWGLLYRSRRVSTSGAGVAAELRFRRRVVQLLIVTAYFLVCPAWFGLFRTVSAAINIWGFALTAVVFAFTVSLIRGGQGGGRTALNAGATPVGDRTPDACWKWGLFYVNPEDPSILIEKRFGIGYTLNFGNRWTWVVLVVVLVPSAAGFIFLR
jgi:uncharacterized membrane protein